MLQKAFEAKEREIEDSLRQLEYFVIGQNAVSRCINDASIFTFRGSCIVYLYIWLSDYFL